MAKNRRKNSVFIHFFPQEHHFLVFLNINKYKYFPTRITFFLTGGEGVNIIFFSFPSAFIHFFPCKNMGEGKGRGCGVLNRNSFDFLFPPCIYFFPQGHCFWGEPFLLLILSIFPHENVTGGRGLVEILFLLFLLLVVSFYSPQEHHFGGVIIEISFLFLSPLFLSISSH